MPVCSFHVQPRHLKLFKKLFKLNSGKGRKGTRLLHDYLRWINLFTSTSDYSMLCQTEPRKVVDRWGGCCPIFFFRLLTMGCSGASHYEPEPLFLCFSLDESFSLREEEVKHISEVIVGLAGKEKELLPRHQTYQRNLQTCKILLLYLCNKSDIGVPDFGFLFWSTLKD